MLLTVRYKVDRTMSDETPSKPTAPAMATYTFAGLLTMWWAVAEPVLTWLGSVIESHTGIVFPPGYSMTLKVAIEGTATVVAIRWHMGDKA